MMAEMTPTERKVRTILQKTGWTQQRMAAEFGVSQSTVHRWLIGSDPEGPSLVEIDRLYNDAMELPNGDIASVPLVGYVGAGAAAHFYAESQGELDRVKAPEDATKDTVAVEIRGESLGALFEQWVVYYDEVRSPVTPDMYGRMCVVGLSDDRVLIKKIKQSRAPGLFHLLSNTEEPILDVEIAWAAKVIDMKPR